VLPPLDLSDAQAAAGAGAAAAPARVATSPVRPYDGGDVPSPWAPATYRMRRSLPELPERALAWRLGTDPGGRLAALAGALGLGQPKRDQAGWTAGDRDRSLRVNRLPGLPWSYGSGIAIACTGPWSPGGPAGRRGNQRLAADTAPARNPPAPKPSTTGPGAVSPGRPPSRAPSGRWCRHGWSSRCRGPPTCPAPRRPRGSPATLPPRPGWTRTAPRCRWPTATPPGW
jgi:hypothetical protein